MISTSEESNASGFVDNEKIAILSLRPKQLLMSYVRNIAKQVLHESDSLLGKILDNDYLEEHAVPVCTGLYETNTDLEDFLQNNSDVLVNLMLTSWMWPLNKWGFDTKDKGTAQSLMAIEYRPFVYMASRNTQNPLKLAVTYANPTRELAEDLARNLDNRADNEALESLRFKVRYGIAIISDNIDREQYRNPVDYCGALANPLSYLKPLSDCMMKELLLFFYGTEEKLPAPTDMGHINKWFNLTTNQGLYMLTKPWMASRYRRTVNLSDDNNFF
ncbi:Uncharacterised protein [Legionella steigerwaltii]|uniref:Uncharacterized protein n=1 Tax=Legionella steigerwaltii TaxID=460 RepID=A0A378LAE1_9GAMM|nr:hypothetical protein [Legionella steigerwaltii]KTD70281.1 hypothetical protein Lstg_3283 [Legionella steigerwaltii]STY24015.1 Uncharacterised protein [Legionella steigerwaltii]